MTIFVRLKKEKVEIINPREIHIDDYNYDLPDAQIAKYPLEKRDQSKLLVYQNGQISDHNFYNLADYIPQGSLMVFNNTKVIQARLYFQKQTGANIEIFCLEPETPSDYSLNFQQTKRCSWVCLIGNLKKWKKGELQKIVEIKGEAIHIKARKLHPKGSAFVIQFEWDRNIPFSDILENGGELPIPPYLNRKTEEKDKQTYQTIYSKIKGSVAAPTAGLHFTEKVFDALQQKGVERAEVTLHVGAGTFRPVKSETVGLHEMHSEFISVKKETIKQLLAKKGKIIAVGTTSVRTLESLYHIGEQLESSKPSQPLRVLQWQPYQDNVNRITPEKSLQNILDYLEAKHTDTLLADTQIIIAPGYQFKIVDGIVTNFHQPKSTLLLLVSAFVGGNNWRKIYDHALDHDYRFLSYGDSSLLLKELEINKPEKAAAEKKTEKKSCAKKIITSIILLLAISAIVAGGYFYSLFSTGFNLDKDINIYIDNNTDYKALLDEVNKTAKVRNISHFETTVDLLNLNKENLHTGCYIVKPNMTVLDLVRNLRSGNQTPVRLTFNNVRLKSELVKRVSGQLMFNDAELSNILNDSLACSQYGFTPETIITMFIPNTYEMYWNINVKAFMDRMHKEYTAFWNKARTEKATEIGLTPLQVSILASIVEEECMYSDEYPVVAGLYINRLRKGQLLQADPTVKYAVGDFTLRRIMIKHTKIDSPYNTYLYVGLPPAPIRIPSIQGIDAVLNYTKHDYIYMCAKEDFSGRHNFAVTLAEHNRNAFNYQSELNKRQIFR